MTSANFPQQISPPQQAAVHGTAPASDVGELLRLAGAIPVDGIVTLEQVIAECVEHWQRSLALFQEHGHPHDRDDAVFWLHRMDEAILVRDLRRER